MVIFVFFSDLSEDINIPYEVKKVITVLNNDLKSKIKLNSVDSLIGKMNEYLNKADKNTKKEVALMVIDISPSGPSIIPQQTNIQNLYHNLTKTIPKVSVTDCKNKGFWIDANNIIIKYFETLICKSGNLKKKLCNLTDENQYIDILNNFQSILIPNYYGNFKKKTENYLFLLPFYNIL